MTNQFEKLSNALLDLGMEDWIPLPEATSDPEVLDSVGRNELVATMAAALIDLVESGKLRIYKGRWDEDPSPVLTQEAVELLKDPRWYKFHIEDPAEERIFFVNVDNIREE
jgi:hypothetical protein